MPLLNKDHVIVRAKPEYLIEQFVAGDVNVPASKYAPPDSSLPTADTDGSEAMCFLTLTSSIYSDDIGLSVKTVIGISGENFFMDLADISNSFM